MIVVGDPADRRLAPYRHLNDAGQRRLVEQRDRIFVVEGHLAVGRLLASRYRVQSLVVADTRAEALGDLTAAVLAAGGDVLVAALPVLRATVGFNMHRGVVAVAARPAPADPEAVLVDASMGASPVIVLVEGVNDHENLGALFRNAAAFGVAAVLLDGSSSDPLYRRCVRASMGYVLRVPWARVGPWADALPLVEAAGFAVVALTPDPSVAVLSSLPTGGPVALVIGAEGPGLSAATLAAASTQARIPMAPGVDSLNVATAAAVAFHHFTVGSPR